MKYSGCIIEESLKDKSVINEFKILEKIDDDGIMWIVEIDESKIDNVVPSLQKSMVDDPIWYCDLKCEDWHYIIFNDKSEYALKLANKYGCKNAVCSNFNDDIMECEKIENVSVSNKFTCRSEDFSFSYYKNDNVEYCIFNINNSTMCVGLNEGSTINVCDNRVYDTNGTVNLDDGEVTYYLHGDGSYSARRIDAWQ